MRIKVGQEIMVEANMEEVMDQEEIIEIEVIVEANMEEVMDLEEVVEIEGITLMVEEIILVGEGINLTRFARD